MKIMTIVGLAMLCSFAGCSSTHQEHFPDSNISNSDPSGMGHMRGVKCAVQSRKTGRILNLTADLEIPLEGERRYDFLMGLTFHQRQSYELLDCYVMHAALRFLRDQKRVDGIEFHGYQPVDFSDDWWMPHMDGAKFETQTGMLCLGDQVLFHVPEPLPQNAEWLPLTPATYDQWWALVDSKYGITEMIAGSKQSKN